MGRIRDMIYSKQNTCRDQIIDMLKEVLDDTMQVFDFGAKKHPDSGDTPNFLTENGNKCSLTVRGNSCLHHSADVRAGIQNDHESNLHPALHLIASACILYIRQKRNITHPLDDVGIQHPEDANKNRHPEDSDANKTSQCTGDIS